MVHSEKITYLFRLIVICHPALLRPIFIVQHNSCLGQWNNLAIEVAEEPCEPPVVALITAEVDNHLGSAVIN